MKAGMTLDTINVQIRYEMRKDEVTSDQIWKQGDDVRSKMRW